VGSACKRQLQRVRVCVDNHHRKAHEGRHCSTFRSKLLSPSPPPPPWQECVSHTHNMLMHAHSHTHMHAHSPEAPAGTASVMLTGARMGTKGLYSGDGWGMGGVGAAGWMVFDGRGTTVTRRREAAGSASTLMAVDRTKAKVTLGRLPSGRVARV
jgi:hypothetical protein